MPSQKTKKTKTTKKKRRKPHRNPKGKTNKKAKKKASNSIFSINSVYIILAFSVAVISFLLVRSTDNSLISLFTSSFLYSSVGEEGIRNATTKDESKKEEAQTQVQNSKQSTLKPITAGKDPIPIDIIGYSDLCNTDIWLNRNGSLPGYHVLCVTVDRNLDETKRRKEFEIKFFRSGVLSNGAKYTSTAQNLNRLRLELEKVLKIKLTDKRTQSLPKKDRLSKWAMFTQFGIQITSENWKTHFIGTILITEIGSFMYPPMERGFIRNVTVKNPTITSETMPYMRFELETLSVHPVVFLVKKFIPSAYCDHFIALSNPYMEHSTISHMHNTNGDSNQWRTSKTHWLNPKMDSKHWIDHMDQLTASLTKVPRTHQENVQILKYTETQQYDSHWDYFDVRLYQGTPIENKIRGGMNRLATLFWYMSDVDEGGYTIFPASGNLALPKSFKLKQIEDCMKSGLRVTPRKSNAILFYSFHFNGDLDPLSLHGACPVGKSNIKWAGNKWIWTKPLRKHKANQG